MKLFKASSRRTGPVEVVFNLWWFHEEESGTVTRLAGRAYALGGTDAERVKVLQSLAATDFHIARRFEIPRNLMLVKGGLQLEGVTVPEAVPARHADLFEHVIAALEKEVTDQVHPSRSESPQFSRDPLSITTCIIQHEDGTFTPRIAG